MSVIVVLLLASLGMAVAFLGAFVWAVRSGQFEDTTTPSMRMLTDEDGDGGAGGREDKQQAERGTQRT